MNCIGTSIYIEKGRLARVKNAAALLGVSESELLSMLLQRSRRLFGKNAISGRAVRYQRGCERRGYVIAHIELGDADYEFATSRRYLFKISVSFIFRAAIDCFLESIVREYTQNPQAANRDRKEYITNFHYKHFAITRSEDSFGEYWQIPWPKERKGEKKQKQTR